MSERCGRSRRWWGVGALAVCALIAGAPAWAQRLNFDAAGVFAPQSEKTVAALREALLEEAQKLASSSVAGTPVTAAQQRMRELAAGLLEAGSSFGEEGSVHVLVGRRIAARRGEADEAIRRIGGTDAGVDVLTGFLEACPADGVLIPREPPDLDRLFATVFEPLAVAIGGRSRTAAWPMERLDSSLGAEAAYAAAIEATVENGAAGGVGGKGGGGTGGLSREGVLALERRPGETTGVEALAERQLVVQAATLAAHPVRWLDRDARESLTATFDTAAVGLGVPESRTSARVDMVRLALVADILRRIDAGEFTARQARSMRATGSALARELVPGVGDSDDAISALRRGLVLLEQYDAIRWSDNRRLVREVRPLWRETEIRARRARDELIEALSRVTPVSGALSDPGILGGLSAVTSAIADARGLCTISAWLAGAEDARAAGLAAFNSTPPDSRRERRPDPILERDDRVRRQAGVRLLSLATKMRSPRTQEKTVAAVRELAQGLEVWLPVGDAGAGATPEILAAIEDARARWVSAWTGLDLEEEAGGPHGSTAEVSPATQLTQLAELVRIGADAREVARMAASGGRTGALAWPGFELSTGAMDMAISPLKTDLPRAAVLVRPSDSGALERALISMRGHAKIVATLAGIERAAAARRVVARGLFDELASPPPSWPTLDEDLTPGVWLGSVRESVAMLCRGLEEYADATKAGERERSEAIRRFVVAECDRVQRALGMR